tara:strand:+ start:59 stop:307 length:249 start_codon:yes stop_codon:yes gene_type:complete
MIIKPLSASADIASAANSTINDATLIRVVNVSNATVKVTIAGSVATDLYVTAGESVIIEKEQGAATTSNGSTVWATKIAYAN